MNVLGRTFAVAALTLKPSLRQPLFILLVSVLPLSLFVMFQVIGGAGLGQHALYGIIIVLATNAGVISLPQITVTYRNSRLQEMYVASPVGPGMYALGLGLSRLLFALPAILLIFAVLMVRGGMRPSALLQALLVVLCASFCGVMIGFTLSLLVPNVYMISTVANLTGMILTVLPPVYYPLAMVPPGWRWLAMLAPTANAAELLRISGGASTSSASGVLVHWTILLLETFACGMIVFRQMRWQER
ncbi:MAG TPA: ABC transporter permease [Thermoanaerobaculia bacterium]|jgi:ABC-2 type transport system permease protein